MELGIEARPDGVAIVRPVGRLDLLSAAEFKQCLAETVSGGHHRLVVDLQGIPFIDSSGLAALIGGLKAARVAGGDLRLARPGEQARVIMELTSLDRVLRLYDAVEEALSGW